MKNLSLLRHTGVLFASAAALVALSSCNDEEKKEAPVEEQPAAAAPAAPSVEKKAALFDNMLYTMSKSFTAQAANPMWTEIVRDHLVALQEYYEEMAPASQGTLARTKLAVRVAQVLSDLTSFDKAVAAFNTAMEDFNAMGDADKNGEEGQVLLSTIYNGLGSCLLSGNKVTEALPNYEKALEVDTKRVNALLPDGKVPEGEVSPAVSSACSDVISSARCLAFCQRVAEDPEEARETIKKAVEMAKTMEKIPAETSLQFVRLLTALGDLESACGKNREALTAWSQAAAVCQQSYQQFGRGDIRAEAQVLLRQLVAAIKEVQAQMGEEPAPEGEEGAEPETVPAE